MNPSERFFFSGDSKKYSSLITFEVKKEKLNKEFKKPLGVEWEPFSEKGFSVSDFKSSFIKRAIQEYTFSQIEKVSFPCDEIQGANLFDSDLPPIKAHLDSFGFEEGFFLKSRGKNFVLPHAGCYQAFSFFSRKFVREKSLPHGLVEFVDCYRKEGTGELKPNFRQSRFKMVDLHVFTLKKDSLETLKELHARIDSVFKDLNFEMQLMVSFGSEEKMSQSKEILESVIGEDYLGRVVNGNVYWNFNVEYHCCDSFGKPIEIATIQADDLSQNRFNLSLADSGEPIRIFHTAFLGTIERANYLLEDRGFPPWASPFQIILFLIDGSKLDLPKLREILGSNSVTIDDRRISLSKKIKGSFNFPFLYRLILEKGGSLRDISNQQIFSLESLSEKLHAKGAQRRMRGFVSFYSKEFL